MGFNSISYRQGMYRVYYTLKDKVKDKVKDKDKDMKKERLINFL